MTLPMMDKARHWLSRSPTAYTPFEAQGFSATTHAPTPVSDYSWTYAYTFFYKLAARKVIPAAQLQDIATSPRTMVCQSIEPQKKKVQGTKQYYTVIQIICITITAHIYKTASE